MKIDRPWEGLAIDYFSAFQENEGHRGLHIGEYEAAAAWKRGDGGGFHLFCCKAASLQVTVQHRIVSKLVYIVGIQHTFKLSRVVYENMRRLRLVTDVDDLSFRYLPDGNRRRHMNVKGSNDAELRDLQAKINFLEILYWDSLLFLPKQKHALRV